MPVYEESLLLSLSKMYYVSVPVNPVNNKKDNTIPFALWLILILFFIKCLILAFSITPLWDIHDEPGHYSYIQDIAMGKGLPIIGKTPIAQNVFDNWYPDKAGIVSPNWIAQHPPLYHIIGAGLLFFVSLFTQDSYWLFHAPRLVSSFFATGTLLVIFLFLRDYTNDEIFALSCCAIVGFIPMYSHMASGTNHDMALVFFCSLAFFFLQRFISFGLNKYAYLSAFFIGAACATKFSAFLLALPIIVIIIFFLEGGWFVKIRNIIYIGFFASILPCFYPIRNWFLLGSPFVLAGLEQETLKLKNIGIIEYLQINPVVNELFNNFFGAIGWTGTGNGELLWFQIGGVHLFAINMVLLVIFSLSFLWYLKERFNKGGKLDFIMIFFVIILFGAILLGIYIDKNYSIFTNLLYSLILTMPFLSAFAIRIKGRIELIPYLSLAIILFYLITFTNFFLIPSYEQYGWARALHGRYFFPLIPLFLISYFYPAYKLIKPPRWMMFSLVIFSAIFEFSFFIEEVIPFYNQVI